MIVFAPSVIADRLKALSRALDAGGAGGKILLYGGTRPAAGAAASGPLVTFTLHWPCLAGVTGGTLTLQNPDPAMATATGTVTWARFTDSTGAWVLDCDAGGLIDVAGAVQAGGEVTLTLASLSEV